MRWIFVFSLFLSPIFALVREDFCEEPFLTCTKPMENQFLDLQTVEEVKSVCPKFINYIACLGNFDKTCEGKAWMKIFPREGEFESVRDMIADICDENSLLHTALMENVQCLRDGMYNDDNNTCYEENTELDPSLYSTPSDDKSEDYEHSYSSIASCYSGLYRATCYLEYVDSNCGTLTKEAVIEVLLRSYGLRNFCNSEGAFDLAEVMNKVEIRNSLKDILKEVLQGILKKET